MVVIYRRIDYSVGKRMAGRGGEEEGEEREVYNASFT